MAGSAGQGRPKGARNKRTQQLLELAGDGESPVEFGLAIMRDDTKTLDVRLNAARLIAPYLHARPAPVGEIVTFDLPEAATLQNVTDAVAAILKAVSQGQMTVSTGRDLVAMIDVQRKSLELVEIEKRIEALERARGDT
jgi:hypothetical protein